MGGGNKLRGAAQAEPLSNFPVLAEPRCTSANVFVPTGLIKGSPQERLAQVTKLLTEADESAAEALADVRALVGANKGALLAYAKENDLWKAAEPAFASFEAWGRASWRCRRSTFTAWCASSAPWSKWPR
ncbi:hypothetical protein [Streptomyces sp. NPDC054865]